MCERESMYVGECLCEYVCEHVCVPVEEVRDCSQDSFSVSFETGSEFAVLAGLQVVSLWRSTCFCSIAQQSFNPLFTGPGDRLNMYIF